MPRRRITEQELQELAEKAKRDPALLRCQIMARVKSIEDWPRLSFLLSIADATYRIKESWMYPQDEQSPTASQL